MASRETDRETSKLGANEVQPQDVTRLQVTVDDTSPQGIDDIGSK